MNIKNLDNIPATDIMSLYIAEATRTPLLSASEERALIRTIKRGTQAEKKLAQHETSQPNTLVMLRLRVKEGKQSRTRLIKANTRLVISIAQKYRGMGIPLIDLVQEGNIGLIYAIEKFDLKHGTRFATYATWWIRQHIVRALTNQSKAIRIPSHINLLLQKAEQTRSTFEQKYQRDPSLSELAQMMGISVTKLKRAIQTAQTPVSLDAPATVDGDISLAEVLPDEKMSDATRRIQRNELKTILQDALCSLNIRQAKILMLRYGLLGSEPHSRQEIGKKFGLNRERIRQLEVDALNKLRQSPRWQSLQDFL